MAKSKKQKDKDSAIIEAGQLEVIYYTDPLCCWSWAMEPELRKFRFHLKNQIHIRHCMGGLLPDWKNYNDEINSVSRPLQLGPVWMHAAQLSGMPMQSSIWMKDPPRSSYPACIAVTTATLQSFAIGEKYLRLLREAVMLQGKNIADKLVLTDVAAELLNEADTDFDLSRFKTELENGTGVEAFRKDLQEVKLRDIIRFPSLIMKNTEGKALIITGYRPYQVLLEAAGKLTKIQNPEIRIDIEEYKAYWFSLTPRELEIAVDLAS